MDDNFRLEPFFTSAAALPQTHWERCPIPGTPYFITADSNYHYDPALDLTLKQILEEIVVFLQEDIDFNQDYDTLLRELEHHVNAKYQEAVKEDPSRAYNKTKFTLRLGQDIPKAPTTFISAETEEPVYA